MAGAIHRRGKITEYFTRARRRRRRPQLSRRAATGGAR